MLRKCTSRARPARSRIALTGADPARSLPPQLRQVRRRTRLRTGLRAKSIRCHRSCLLPTTTRSTCRPFGARPRWSSSSPARHRAPLRRGCRRKLQPCRYADGHGLVQSSTYTYSVQRCALFFILSSTFYRLLDETDFLYSARATGRTCEPFFAIRCQVDNGVTSPKKF